jgi:hypothetical protein
MFKLKVIQPLPLPQLRLQLLCHTLPLVTGTCVHGEVLLDENAGIGLNGGV